LLAAARLTRGRGPPFEADGSYSPALGAPAAPSAGDGNC
jgi:hypothetical protein